MFHSITTAPGNVIEQEGIVARFVLRKLAEHRHVFANQPLHHFGEFFDIGLRGGRMNH